MKESKPHDVVYGSTCVFGQVSDIKLRGRGLIKLKQRKFATFRPEFLYLNLMTEAIAH
jgi:hypothetical protein